MKRGPLQNRINVLVRGPLLYFLDDLLRLGPFAQARINTSKFRNNPRRVARDWFDPDISLLIDQQFRKADDVHEKDMSDFELSFVGISDSFALDLGANGNVALRLEIGCHDLA